MVGAARPSDLRRPAARSISVVVFGRRVGERAAGLRRGTARLLERRPACPARRRAALLAPHTPDTALPPLERPIGKFGVRWTCDAAGACPPLRARCAAGVGHGARDRA